MIERLRVGDAVKAHGWTALFAAVTVVMTRIETTDFALDAMHGRTMGWATAQGFDVSVRTGLVWSSLVLALVVFAGVALGLARLGRLLGERAVDLCEPLALAGLAFWLARAFTLPMWSSINLVMALCAANLAIAALDRFVFRVEGPTARGAWLASLAIAGLGIVTLHDDFRAWNAPSAARAMDWIVGLAPLLLHALARLATWRRDPARRAAAFALLFPALPWLAWLPFASVMREELYLGLGRGDAGPSLNTLEACVLAVLAACAVASSWKARRAGSLPDLAPLVERRSLPWVIAAATALAFYRPWSPLHPDLMEPANPGLLVQQYFDFGRVPFVETFGAHGLSDSFSGFLYRAVNGMREEQWIYWEFLDPVVLAVVLYAALRAATRNAWLALFAVAFFPFLCEVAPTYCGLALAAPFVARAAARRGSALAWFGWALFHAFLFLWRLDLGFASLIASAGALAALAWLDPSSRPRWSPLLRGLGGATLLGLAAWFLVCAARGVDGVARLVDLAHVVGSSQGFSAPILARTYTPLFHVHHFVVPAGVLVLLVVLLAREKGRVAEGTPRRALAFTLVFACIYYFANMQRGLVRHTFLEMGNVFLGSFAFLAFALAWWIADGLTERARAACFVGTATLLAGAFGLAGPLPENAGALRSAFTVLEQRLATYPRQQPSVAPVHRTLLPPPAEDRNYRRFLDFAERHLLPDETFLDLANVPMLYVAARRRSPHWLNHLLLVHDDYLQRRAIAEFEQHELPFVIVRTEPDLAQLDGVRPFNSADDVPNSFRHYRLHEWTIARYEPLCIVQRWQLWGRRDWTGPSAPEGGEERVLAEHAGPFPAARVLAIDVRGGATRAAGRQAYLRMRGTVGRDERIHVRLVHTDGTEFERELRLRVGASEHVWMLPALAPRGALARIELDARRASTFVLAHAALCERTPVETQDLAARLQRYESLELQGLPRMWAREASDVLRGAVLRELPLDQGATAPIGTELVLEDRSGPVYDRGIQRDKPGLVLADLPSSTLLSPGVRVRFAQSGEREVVRVWGRRALVDGALLDPAGDGAPNTVRVLGRSASTVAPEGPIAFRFEPLPDPRMPCYLHLRLRRIGEGAAACSAAWGRSGLLRGSYTFQIAGAGTQDYLLRLSPQPSWALEACDWIELALPKGACVVETARLIAGD